MVVPVVVPVVMPLVMLGMAPVLILLVVPVVAPIAVLHWTSPRLRRPHHHLS